jgi:glucose/arabinose dehydrogenase
VRTISPVLVAVATVVAAASPAHGQLRGQVVASGFAAPVAFVQVPGQPNVQLVVEQRGRIRVVQDGVVLPGSFLDLTGQMASGGEQGLLGLALAPDYATSGRLWVNFTDLAGDTVVARFTRSASNPLAADPVSRFDLVWPGGTPFIVQPFANHNGGNLAFGPDGFLYIGMGDGGSANDPGNLAQDPQSLLGKMLRIDVNVPGSDPRGYRVPPSNPFVGQAGVLAEIWAFGLRNPWRWSFDDPTRGGTGALLIGDVGQGAWEEIDYEPAGRGGRNYGWRLKEGTHPNVTTLPPAYLPLTDPIFEYPHPGGVAITGGFVYRGNALGPAYRGRYFFGDSGTGRVWSLGLVIDPQTGEATAGNLLEHSAELGAAAGAPVSFGVDAAGELYVVNYGAGTVSRILPAVVPAAPKTVVVDAAQGTSLATMWKATGVSVTAGQRLTLRVGGNQTWISAGVSWGPGGNPQDLTTPNDSPLPGAPRMALVGRIGISGTPFLVGRYAQFTATVSGELYLSANDEWYLLWNNSGTMAVNVYAGGSGAPTEGDYDLDARADITIYRPASGEWWGVASKQSYDWQAGYLHSVWGQSNQAPVPGDYDGDGKMDLGVYQADTGEWWILTSSSGYNSQSGYIHVLWGSPGDIPVPADYDGDGWTDIGVYRPSTGEWWVITAATGFNWTAGYTRAVCGMSGDVPVTGDYDGDGKADMAVYRPQTGEWWGVYSSQNYAWTGTYLHVVWGGPGMLAVPGDYDGDGKADIGVYGTATGAWHILKSSNGYDWNAGYITVICGGSGMSAVPRDFDGDGKTDPAVYQASTGDWWILKSGSGYWWGAGGYWHVRWGAMPGDVPIGQARQ